VEKVAYNNSLLEAVEVDLFVVEIVVDLKEEDMV
jgi:hypothetical protein